MSDKDKDAKTSSIAKTLNKVEDRPEKGENCSSVAEGLANVAKASELLSSVWTLPPSQLLRSIMIRGSLQSMAIPRRASTATKMMRNDSLRSVLLKSHDISGLCTPME